MGSGFILLSRSVVPATVEAWVTASTCSTPSTKTCSCGQPTGVPPAEQWAGPSTPLLSSSVWPVGQTMTPWILLASNKSPNTTTGCPSEKCMPGPGLLKSAKCASAAKGQVATSKARTAVDFMPAPEVSEKMLLRDACDGLD